MERSTLVLGGLGWVFGSDLVGVFFGITVPVLLMSQPSPRETLRKLEVYKVFV